MGSELCIRDREEEEEEEEEDVWTRCMLRVSLKMNVNKITLKIL